MIKNWWTTQQSMSLIWPSLLTSKSCFAAYYWLSLLRFPGAPPTSMPKIKCYSFPLKLHFSLGTISYNPGQKTKVLLDYFVSLISFINKSFWSKNFEELLKRKFWFSWFGLWPGNVYFLILTWGYVYWFYRETGGERKISMWERNIDQLPSHMHPDWGSNLQIRCGHWLGMEPTTF